MYISKLHSFDRLLETAYVYGRRWPGGHRAGEACRAARRYKVNIFRHRRVAKDNTHAILTTTNQPGLE